MQEKINESFLQERCLALSTNDEHEKVLGDGGEKLGPALLGNALGELLQLHAYGIEQRPAEECSDEGGEDERFDDVLFATGEISEAVVGSAKTLIGPLFFLAFFVVSQLLKSSEQWPFFKASDAVKRTRMEVCDANEFFGARVVFDGARVSTAATDNGGQGGGGQGGACGAPSRVRDGRLARSRAGA